MSEIQMIRPLSRGTVGKGRPAALIDETLYLFGDTSCVADGSERVDATGLIMTFPVPR